MATPRRAAARMPERIPSRIPTRRAPRIPFGQARRPAVGRKPLGEVRAGNFRYQAFYDSARTETPVRIVALNQRTKQQSEHRLTHEEYIAFRKKLHASRARNPAELAAAIAAHPDVLRILVQALLHI